MRNATTLVTKHRRDGISLVEVLASMVLVGVLMAAAMRSVGGVMQTWNASLHLHRGQGLAQQLMTEILQQSYENPDGSPIWGIESPESPTERSAWDDVDDYDGWSAVPQSKAGSSLVGYEQWRREVTVDYTDLANPTQSSLTDQGLKRITVTVTDPRGAQTILVGYRSRWGLLTQAPDADTTVTTHVHNEMRIGAGARLQSGTHVTNHAE